MNWVWILYLFSSYLNRINMPPIWLKEYTINVKCCKWILLKVNYCYWKFHCYSIKVQKWPIIILKEYLKLRSYLKVKMKQKGRFSFLKALYKPNNFSTKDMKNKTFLQMINTMHSRKERSSRSYSITSTKQRSYLPKIKEPWQEYHSWRQTWF